MSNPTISVSIRTLVEQLSAQSAEGARLTSEQRTAWVRIADAWMTSRPREPSAVVPARLLRAQAISIACAMATYDAGRQHNPFVHPDLRQIYRDQLAYLLAI